MQRDVMNYDLLIVGAGPAGLAAAIRFKQLANDAGKDLSVCVLEKAAEVGAQIVSGAVIDPIALNELIPDWKEKGAPLKTPVSDDKFQFMTGNKAWTIPHWLMPPLMKNNGNYIGSLGELCSWLAGQAEQLGVEIYAGFSAQEALYDEEGNLIGIITGDMGRDAQGQETAQFVAGIEIQAPFTFIAEGARGSLARQLESHFNLRDENRPAKFGLGIKEIWRIPEQQHQSGYVSHSFGWPLSDDTGGGAFVYHYGEQLVSIGMVVHLDYSNPYLSPFEEFQRFKTHPDIRSMLSGGKRLSYGARAISEGGLQSLPDLIFPGGAFIGCSAGMVNVPKIKGSHNAMKSGMLAAEAAFDYFAAESEGGKRLLMEYPIKLNDSWVWKELGNVRNFKPLLSRFGNLVGGALAGVELWLSALHIKFPWTLKHQQADHHSLKPKSQVTKIDYPKPDGELTFDRLSSIDLSNLVHDDNQPCHLQLKDKTVPITINLNNYDAPEQRYCPAGVYEIIEQAGEPSLQINAQNCIHCKTCDIKDPTQNIVWVPPEGGSGPVYKGM
ncbi:MAG TPA: electron transfer flavoprotein-ubiquinone oxidoreductase [Methylophaga aminisulfidivorans]|uniref:electron transfer flavoprotein-ubiquinone oxidoreductase n=1 Tax=Methylophaga TaxID=40222 RepID=UPI0017778574|nr:MULTISPECIES: electron transfer flavoprotein-ubiquinone oxidoreductase [Methylophaga]HIC46505.1 electron transfer flavoprotein-ubiquinone oxidoreductase [Methylophaga sp.]HIM38809.1 electron transfer flavoprotein-ubiquinone oxidoreductase [Methylophaga aminisulfidivorans]